MSGAAPVSRLAARWRLTPRSIERKMRDGSVPPFTRARGSQRPLWRRDHVEAHEAADTFTSLANERAAAMQQQGESKENGSGKDEVGARS